MLIKTWETIIQMVTVIPRHPKSSSHTWWGSVFGTAKSRTFEGILDSIGSESRRWPRASSESWVNFSAVTNLDWAAATLPVAQLVFEGHWSAETNAPHSMTQTHRSPKHFLFHSSTTWERHWARMPSMESSTSAALADCILIRLYDAKNISPLQYLACWGS